VRKTNLSRQRLNIAEARSQIWRGFRRFAFWAVVLLGSTGGLTVILFIKGLADGGYVVDEDATASGVWCALFVFFLLIFSLGFHQELFEPYRLMPYFSGNLPPKPERSFYALKSGEKLLENSVALDELAEAEHLPRIGSFLTTCQSYYGPARAWFDPAEGLRMVNGLLEKHGSHPAVTAAHSDLAYLQGRFGEAVTAGVQFCLYVTQGYAGNSMSFACQDVRS